jgi:hypothetical protein
VFWGVNRTCSAQSRRQPWAPPPQANRSAGNSSTRRAEVLKTPLRTEVTAGKPFLRAGDRTRTGDVQLGKRVTPTLTSAHRRKSLYEVPFPASQRQPALARLYWERYCGSLGIHGDPIPPHGRLLGG